MNLYLISQTENEGYETYDSAVVCAETEAEAQRIHPQYGEKWDGKANGWCDAKQVKGRLIGIAAPWLESGKVICASFNAG